MRTQILAKVGLVLLTITTICHAADSLYYYSQGREIPVPIDRGKIAVRFEGVTLDEGAAGRIGRDAAGENSLDTATAVI
jgi:hypothetical protein